MKHKLFLFTIFGFFILSAYAQSDRTRGLRSDAGTANTAVVRDANKLPQDTVNWKKGGDISFSFAQTHLTNWNAGGENALSLSSAANFFANYKKNKLIWENNATMTYGIIKAGDRKAVKNADQINIGSRAGYQMAEKWYYTAALLGRTQFARGYRYSATDTTLISNFFAPAYMFLSLGLDYKPSSNLSISLSPAMGKATFVFSDDHNILLSSGMPQDMIDDGKRARYEFGGGIVFKLDGGYFSNRVTYTSQLELFSNYFDKPQNIDVAWDFQFRVALSRFVASTVRINMLYYDSQKTIKTEMQPDGTKLQVPHGAQLQVKEYFEIGLVYNF